MRLIAETLRFAGALEMYSFRVHPKDGRIVVRIDKPSDRCVNAHTLRSLLVLSHSHLGLQIRLPRSG